MIMKRTASIFALLAFSSACAFAAVDPVGQAQDVVERETTRMMNSPLLMLQERERIMEQERQKAPAPIINNIKKEETVVPVIEEVVQEPQTVEQYIKQNGIKGDVKVMTFEEIRQQNAEAAKKEMEAAKKAAIEAKKGKQ